MRFIRLAKIAELLLAGALCFPAHAQTSPDPSSIANLAPIAFLTAHEWEAQLPDQPDGKKRRIHAQFTWTQNHQAIRISNEFVIDGKPSPYVDGLYAWDPQQHLVLFWYIGADGSLTKGTVKTDGATLVHDFEETQSGGKTAKYVARVTPNEQGWRNEIFAQSDSGLKPIVGVQYTPARRGASTSAAGGVASDW
jgi:hypothetical protein